MKTVPESRRVLSKAANKINASLTKKGKSRTTVFKFIVLKPISWARARAVKTSSKTIVLRVLFHLKSRACKIIALKIR